MFGPRIFSFPWMDVEQWFYLTGHRIRGMIYV